MATEGSEWQVIRRWLRAGSINVFGPPNSGKGTQARRIAGRIADAEVEVPMIGGGEVLRELHAANQLPDRSWAELQEGGLYPRQEYVATVLPLLKERAAPGLPLILDCVGRGEGEPEAVMQVLDEIGHPLRAVVELTASEHVLQQRLARAQHVGDRAGRLDDDLSKLPKRMELYRTETLAVLQFYREQGFVVRVDGSGNPDEVEALIMAALYRRAAADASQAMV